MRLLVANANALDHPPHPALRLCHSPGQSWLSVTSAAPWPVCQWPVRVVSSPKAMPQIKIPRSGGPGWPGWRIWGRLSTFSRLRKRRGGRRSVSFPGPGRIQLLLQSRSLSCYLARIYLFVQTSQTEICWYRITDREPGYYELRRGAIFSPVLCSSVICSPLLSFVAIIHREPVKDCSLTGSTLPAPPCLREFSTYID